MTEPQIMNFQLYALLALGTLSLMILVINGHLVVKKAVELINSEEEEEEKKKGIVEIRTELKSNKAYTNFESEPNIPVPPHPEFEPAL